MDRLTRSAPRRRNVVVRAAAHGGVREYVHQGRRRRSPGRELRPSHVLRQAQSQYRQHTAKNPGVRQAAERRADSCRRRPVQSTAGARKVRSGPLDAGDVCITPTPRASWTDTLPAKSPLAVATERDQLIAQARTRFAKDPKTENGVIGLFNSEAQKHGAAMNAAVPRSTRAHHDRRRRGVPTPHRLPPVRSPPSLGGGDHDQRQTANGTHLNRHSVPAIGGAGVRTVHQSAVIPITAPTATSAVVPSAVAPTQQKVTSWGTTPAWTPPAAATATAAAGAPVMTTAPHIVTAIRPATALRTIQPVQRSLQQAAPVQSAPSSMTANP